MMAPTNAKVVRMPFDPLLELERLAYDRVVRLRGAEYAAALHGTRGRSITLDNVVDLVGYRRKRD